MKILTVDPGLRACGVALWIDAKLRRAELVPSGVQKIAHLGPAVSTMASRVYAAVGNIDLVVVELPQTYRGRAAKGDANDLIAIATVGGAILRTFHSPGVLVLPHEWKGTIPKKTKEGVNIIRERAREKLSEEELANVSLPASSLEHNVYDAIGLGLWYLER
jgi:hypothetical protein